jgi:hypothetical protein
VINLKWASAALVSKFFEPPGPFWSLDGSKMFKTSYLLGSRTITRFDPGHETFQQIFWSGSESTKYTFVTSAFFSLQVKWKAAQKHIKSGISINP